MTPTTQMMEDAKKLANAKTCIDEQKVYQMTLPDGRVVDMPGSELIRTGEAFAELMQASSSGNQERMKAALQRVAAIGCDA